MTPEKKNLDFWGINSISYQHGQLTFYYNVQMWSGEFTYSIFIICNIHSECRSALLLLWIDYFWWLKCLACCILRVESDDAVTKIEISWNILYWIYNIHYGISLRILKSLDSALLWYKFMKCTNSIMIQSKFDTFFGFLHSDCEYKYVCISITKRWMTCPGFNRWWFKSNYFTFFYSYHSNKTLKSLSHSFS